MSSEVNDPVENSFLKPEEWIEPSERKMTTLLPLQASGYQKSYHVLLRGWLAPVLLFCAVGLLVYSVRLAAVTGSSMEPSLHEGSRIVFERLTPRLLSVHRGDIIVFKNPRDVNMLEVKRVIGLPGELVLIEGGTISVTPPGGRIQEFPRGTYVGGNGQVGDFRVQLGPQEYFVLGDNRSMSTDSRAFGAVHPGDILGRVIYSF